MYQGMWTAFFRCLISVYLKSVLSAPAGNNPVVISRRCLIQRWVKSVNKRLTNVKSEQKKWVFRCFRKTALEHDAQTEILYQYRASAYRRGIKTTHTYIHTYIQMQRLKWHCHSTVAGALYKIIVSNSCSAVTQQWCDISRPASCIEMHDSKISRRRTSEESYCESLDPKTWQDRRICM